MPISILLRLTGDLSQDKGYLPWRWQVLIFLLHGAVQVRVKCAKFHILEPPARDKAPSWAGPCLSTLVSTSPWKQNPLFDLLETHRGPAPFQGPPFLKITSPYQHPSWSSACTSKWAKWHLEEIYTPGVATWMLGLISMKLVPPGQDPAWAPWSLAGQGRSPEFWLRGFNFTLSSCGPTMC